MAKRASVPQFGTWENQNVGYTMYFENVRNDKSGAGPKKIINPNDPQEMQHANYGGSANRAAPRAEPQRPNQHRPKPEHHQNYQNQKPNQNYFGESSYESSPARSRPSPGPNKRPNAVPKFGDWGDINSSPAGGGYTMQFDNLKKKKDAAKASPIQIPAEPVPMPESYPYRNDSSFLSKLLGCFSPNTRN